MRWNLNPSSPEPSFSTWLWEGATWRKACAMQRLLAPSTFSNFCSKVGQKFCSSSTLMRGNSKRSYATWWGRRARLVRYTGPNCCQICRIFLKIESRSNLEQIRQEAAGSARGRNTYFDSLSCYGVIFEHLLEPSHVSQLFRGSSAPLIEAAQACIRVSLWSDRGHVEKKARGEMSRTLPTREPD